MHSTMPATFALNCVNFKYGNALSAEISAFEGTKVKPEYQFNYIKKSNDNKSFFKILPARISSGKTWGSI